MYAYTHIYMYAWAMTGSGDEVRAEVATGARATDLQALELGCVPIEAGLQMLEPVVLVTREILRISCSALRACARGLEAGQARALTHTRFRSSSITSS